MPSDPGSELAELERENAELVRTNAELLGNNAELLAEKAELLEKNAELRAALADAQAAGARAEERATRAGVRLTAGGTVATAVSRSCLDKYQSIVASLRDRQGRGGAMTRMDHAVVELADALADAADRLDRFDAESQAEEAYMNEVVARYFRLAQEIEPIYLDMTLTQMNKREQEKREREQADAEREATAQAHRALGTSKSAKTRSANAEERKTKLRARGLQLAAAVPARLLSVTRVAKEMAKDPECQKLAPLCGSEAKEPWKSWMPIACLVLKNQ